MNYSTRRLVLILVSLLSFDALHVKTFSNLTFVFGFSPTAASPTSLDDDDDDE